MNNLNSQCNINVKAMKRQTKDFNNAKPVGNIVRSKLEEEFLQDCEDSALQESVSEYMKARLDIEDVINDPGFTEMDYIVKGMISDYNTKSRNKENEKFIKDAFSHVSEEQLLEEISNIKHDINGSAINDLTAEWVKEWHAKRQMKSPGDIKREEIREFITSSLEMENETVPVLSLQPEKSVARKLFIRYTSLSAAAVLGAFLMIKTIVPGSNPDRLFNKYYEPFDAVSPVTRSVTGNSNDPSSNAIEKYKTGDYQIAASAFAESVAKYPSDFDQKFYLAITELQLQNYNNAINILSEVSAHPGDYGKEAKWYLGLAYLKTGQKEKAYECFNFLVQHKGYYSKRSEKILRRLK